MVIVWYIGVSVDVMFKIVVISLECVINGVFGMIYMIIVCINDGMFFIIIYFKVGIDLDVVVVNV